MKTQVLQIKKLAAVAFVCALPVLANAQIKFSGQVFGDYAYKLHSDSVSNRPSKAQYANKKDYQGFDIRRVYLGADYDLTKNVHFQLNLANEGDVLPDNNRAFYLKAANLRFKNFFTGSDLIIGQQTTPTFAAGPGSEATWGYRFEEKTIMDMRGIASSNDLGVGLEGKYADGNFGYNILYGNNNGAKLVTSPSTSADNAHRLYADAYYRFLNKQFIVQVYGDYSSCANTDPKVTGANETGKYTTTNTTLKGFVAYTGKIVTVGVEGFSQTKANAGLDSAKNLRDVTPFGFSVFAHAALINDTAKNGRGAILSIFARYDSWNPDTNIPDNTIKSSTAPAESFITAGIDWVPVKNVHITPNIWINNYAAKTGAKYSTDRSDNDMAARVTFFWKF